MSEEQIVISEKEERRQEIERIFNPDSSGDFSAIYTGFYLFKLAAPGSFVKGEKPRSYEICKARTGVICW